MSDDFKWPNPRLVAPVKAVPESELLKDWPILFKAGNSGADFDDWGLCTDHVHASLLASCEFPNDARDDAKFIAALINAYRNGEIVRKEDK